ncbi:MAG: hypothetical protein WC729_08630 [Sphingomonas sp.]|jgi:hypothetical protein|uniref:hypothetical protein n=1 Tax=Sphingomonas sp. TaxID=28214 RepID=UPI0035619002
MRLGPAHLAVLMLLVTPAAANAYLGPGLGLGVLSVAIGGFASVVLGFLGVLWYR